MPLSIPLETIQTLSDAEKAGLKEEIVRWALSNSRIEQKVLHENLSLATADKIPVYDFTLSTLLETRNPNPEEITRPLPETPVAPAPPIARDQINLWDFPSESPKEFKEHHGTYPIDASFQLRDCPECLREGRSTCRDCAGAGQTACLNCHGAGKVECAQCKGFGKTNCLKCSGRGLAPGVTLLVRASDACDACQGLGKVPCGQCSHGQMACTLCAGSGRRACSKCQAQGKVPCPTCQTRGQVMAGMAFLADFRPFPSAAAAPAAEAPKQVWQKALLHKKPAATPVNLPDFVTDENVAQSGFPETIKAAFRSMGQKVQGILSANTRICRQEINFQRAYVVRLEGTFYQQKFIYWFLPDTKEIFPEKNPLQNLVETTTQEAQEAIDEDNWVKGFALASRALSYDPTNEDAKKLLQTLKRKVFFETLTAALAAGLIVSAGIIVYIYYGIQGLHKLGPSLTAGGVVMLLALCCGILWPVILMRRPRRRRLVLTTALVYTMGVLGIFVGVMASLADWNGVKKADQRSFLAEFNGKFPNGISDVYWEPDLSALEVLQAKYERTQADISIVKEGLEKQGRLKAEREAHAREFHQQLIELMRADSPMRLDERRAKLKELRDLYELRGIDVKAADDGLKSLDLQRAAAHQREPQSRLSIIQLTKPAPAKKQVIKKADKKKIERQAKKEAKKKKKKKR